MGAAEAIKGLLSAISGGWWGMWSDTNGRRPALLYTVLGTASSTILLSFSSLIPLLFPSLLLPTKTVLTAWLVLFTLSGLFSSTFTLTFAYISDSTQDSRSRLAGYGMALATFGLSFCVGPMAGGAVADWDAFVLRYNAGDGGGEDSRTREEEGEEEVAGEMAGEGEAIPGAGSVGADFTSVYQEGVRRVLLLSLVLVALDVIYILIRGITLTSLWSTSRTLNLPDPFQALRTFNLDPYLRCIGSVTFLYYTAVWSVISSLAFYCNKTLGFGPGRLGELMSLFGVCTVLAEGVLVRVAVPAFGPVRVAQAGLLTFAVQCAGFSVARKTSHVFALVTMSTVTNLVYPSIAGMVSEKVGKERIGETLGAVNSIKALTEGFGPLVFGVMMTGMEGTGWPGMPYLIAGAMSLAAYARTRDLKKIEDLGYLSEKYGGSGAETGG
ncbi:hypothetical protein TrRE_jg7098, partial [Triparma retinervis]